MVKTEKYKDSVVELTKYSQHVNRQIGDYRSHYLSSDYTFTVELSNGTLKIPLHLAADFSSRGSSTHHESIITVAKSFQAKDPKHRSNRKILEEWRKLFSKKDNP